MKNSQQKQHNSENSNEVYEKLVFVNRVTKVVTGGRNFGFATLVVSGNKKGSIGFGTGKAKEVTDSRNKATKNSQSKMFKIPLKEGRTLHHDVEGSFGSGRVLLRAAPKGTGIIAGGPMRAIFELVGISDIVAKSIGSSNPYNMVRATFEALKSLDSPRSIALRRNKKIGDIIARRNVILGSEVKDE